MADFLELGLEACDKAIDYGFDKLPDRIVSPLGADIPHPHLFHRNKKGDLVNHKGEVQQDTASNREREYRPDRDGRGGQRDRGVGDKPQRSKTMPPEYDGRPKRSGYESDESDQGYRRDRNVERGPSRRSRQDPNGYASSQSRGIDSYVPNPDYGYNNQVATRPPITSRRSQSYAPPRRRRDRSPTISSSSSGASGTPPPENKTKKLIANPYAAGAIGALTGGLLANQAGKASGLDNRRRSKSQSSGRFKKPGEGDEALVTLAGMVLGGVTAAFGSERYKKFRSRKHEERQLWEKNQNNDGRLAQEDFDRDHHEMERKLDTPVGGWARSQADVYPDQIREARKWQAQVEAGERERERTRRDDVVMVEDTRSRREAPRGQKVYRQELIYQPQPEYVKREVVERIEEPLRYERRNRRRSVDDRSDRRREYDRDSGYGYETRPRDRYVVSGGR